MCYVEAGTFKSDASDSFIAKQEETWLETKCGFIIYLFFLL